MKEIEVIEVTVKPCGELDKKLKVLTEKRDKAMLEIIEKYKNGDYNEYFDKL